LLSESGTAVGLASLPCRMARVWLRIRPNRIHFLKFILEGYDGLGLLSTVDAKQGVMVVYCPTAALSELFALLTDLAPGLTFTSSPEKLAEPPPG